jgi:hypothetical protein
MLETPVDELVGELMSIMTRNDYNSGYLLNFVRCRNWRRKNNGRI